MTAAEIKEGFRRSAVAASYPIELIDEYIGEAEHQDGDDCWERVYGNGVRDVLADFVEYAQIAKELENDDHDHPQTGVRRRAPRPRS